MSFYHLMKNYHFFFFNDTAPTEIYPLSLHDALPISRYVQALPQKEGRGKGGGAAKPAAVGTTGGRLDRKSTRLNSSHLVISYAGFCLKKKKKCSNNRIT